MTTVALCEVSRIIDILGPVEGPGRIAVQVTVGGTVARAAGGVSTTGDGDANLRATVQGTVDMVG